MAQGELQGALSNLQTICRIIAPLLWSNLYATGGGNWLYFGAASGASVQFLLSMVIGRSEQVILSVFAGCAVIWANVLRMDLGLSERWLCGAAAYAAGWGGAEAPATP